MKTKNNFIKPALVAGIVAVFACAATAQADDSKTSSSGDDNASQKSVSSSDSSKVSSDNSKSSDDNSQGDNQNSGGVVSPLQSKADAYGLQVAGKVMEGGSDASSKDFQQNVLPSLSKFISAALPETKNNTKSKAFEIDPNKLVLNTKSAVRAYFVSEGAAYHNSVGFEATTVGKDPKSVSAELNSDSTKLIFPDASSTEGGFASGKYGTRTANEPVLPGDFVNLGTFNKGSKLDFFLISNGANQSGAPVFSATESINPDGFHQHVAGFTTKLFAVPELNSPYIFLSFEDLLGGGDKDINDTIVAINIGAANVKALLATPEPTTWLTLGSFLGVAIWAKRRSDRQASVIP